jgi:hypothetical protein
MNAWSRGSLLLIGLAFLAPRLAHAQEAAEVTCKDGTKSHGGKGACSGHGGVDKSASKAAAEPTEKATTSSKSKTTEPTATTAAAPASAEAAEVTCKDGTKSHGGKGACSGHGGVDKTASATHSTSTSSTSTSSTSKSTAAAASSAAAAPAAPEEVICKDGTKSKGGKGACSGHHGVDANATAAMHGGTGASASMPAPASGAGGSAAPPAASAPARAAAPAAAAASPAPATPTSPATAAGQKGPPTAKCKDGSLSYAQHHSGACSDHGGVAQWLDGTQK